MNIAMVGLGKMGANMTTRLLKGGHNVVAFDLREEAITAAEGEGATGARTLEEIAEKLDAPRVVWVMVPSGKPTEDTVFKLARRRLASQQHLRDCVVGPGKSAGAVDAMTWQDLEGECKRHTGKDLLSALAQVRSPAVLVDLRRDRVDFSAACELVARRTERC